MTWEEGGGGLPDPSPERIGRGRVGLSGRGLPGHSLPGRGLLGLP